MLEIVFNELSAAEMSQMNTLEQLELLDLYFEVRDGLVIVHRVLHRGTFSDFLFRSKMTVAEDEELAKSKHFWKLIDEGRNAKHLEK